MGSYLTLRGIMPELILSSCALRAQQTADLLADKIAFGGERYYLQELYLASVEAIMEIVSIQDDTVQSMFIVGHNPQLHELVNSLMDEHISKFPSLGIVAVNFNIDHWDEIREVTGEMDFFIFPKQFKYYMPKQIRSYLAH